MSEKIAILQIKASQSGKSVAIAQVIYDDLLHFLANNPKYLKKFNHICRLISEGKTTHDIYGPEGFDEETKAAHVTAIKIKQGNNPRIYCREISGLTENDTLVVVAASLHESKKNQKLKSKEKSHIRRAAEIEIVQIITEEEYGKLKEQTDN